ncbi:hypothetical protein F5888DRAFT_1238859 [Russula emetica]|nr:hypothetical protein F5888DRAFT_1238859 [Russula emetica]
MRFTDILSFCFSILGLYGLVYFLRFLIPRNLLPYVSAVLTEAVHLLDRAESTGVIPRPNDYRSALTYYSNQFLRIRMESHRAPGILQQLRLAVKYGLTCKLYTLSSRVVAIKVEIKLWMSNSLRRLRTHKAPLLWRCVPHWHQWKQWYEQCCSTTFLTTRGSSLNIWSIRYSFFVFEFLMLVRPAGLGSSPWTKVRYSNTY